MSIYKLPESTVTDNLLIHKLNTSTFEDAYIQKPLAKEPKTFVEKAKKAWTIFLLSTSLGRWLAGDIAGKNGFAAERASIGKYQSALNALITHLSKTHLIGIGLGKEWADFVNVTAESPTTDPYGTKTDACNTELPEKIRDFYTALKERVEVISGDKTDSADITYQAHLIRAGLQEVANKIREHNETHASGLMKQPKVWEWWNIIVDKEIIKQERENLHKEISPDEIVATQESAEDYIAHKISLFHKTFEETSSFDGLKEPESFEELRAHVKEEVQEARAAEFLDKIEELQSPKYIQSRIEERALYLDRNIQKIQNELTPFNKRVESLKNQIESLTEQCNVINPDAIESEIEEITNDQEVIDFLRSSTRQYLDAQTHQEVYDAMFSVDKTLVNTIGANNLVSSYLENGDEVSEEDGNSKWLETILPEAIVKAENTPVHAKLVKFRTLKAKAEELDDLQREINRKQKLLDTNLDLMKTKQDSLYEIQVLRDEIDNIVKAEIETEISNLQQFTPEATLVVETDSSSDLDSEEA